MSIMDMNFSKTLFYRSLIKHSQKSNTKNEQQVLFFKNNAIYYIFKNIQYVFTIIIYASR